MPTPRCLKSKSTGVFLGAGPHIVELISVYSENLFLHASDC